mmetsp:Transcript_64946/g.205176  ORF Transcript_64946/g.205176 Transcript_64946/m.205176 type:complete len:448 (+) Transcript_64946:123-1466(+)
MASITSAARVSLPPVTARRSAARASVLPAGSAACRPVRLLPPTLARARRVPPPCHRRAIRVRAAMEDDEKESPASALAKIAPVELQTPVGEFLANLLTKEPHLFDAAAEQQLSVLSDEKKKILESTGDKEKSEVVLYNRMNEMKLVENQKCVLDLMYLLVCKEFMEAGVPLAPPMDGIVDLDPVNLSALTTDIHSVEALEMVRDHLTGVLGGGAPMAMMNNAPIKMSKVQAAQVYAASVMFGYFLRKVDKRFTLEKSMGGGSGPLGDDDAIARLERMFSSSSSSGDDDAASVTYDVGEDKVDSSSAKDEFPEFEQKAKPDKEALKKYVQSFDQSTMSETARIVSREGVALVERHTAALFGDVMTLKKQMQDVLGDDPLMEQADVIKRLQEAVRGDEIETVTLTYNTQRRVVLEAVAFGSFLHDVESEVNFSYDLTPMLPVRYNGLSV